MGRIQIPFKGISTTSSYEDGEAYSMINLRPKNGVLHPVAPRNILQELSQEYDIVFVHQNNDYKNWIGVVNDNNYSSIYWDVLSDEPKIIHSYIEEKVRSIHQIGNTLSLVTSSDVYYLFFQDNKYIFLGTIPSLPPIELDTSNESHIKKFFTDEYPRGSIKPGSFIDATKGLVNKAMDQLVNGWTDSEGNAHEGFGLRLFDAHYIRYAFRLFDGTLVKHSPPILVMPMRDILEMKSISYDFDSDLRHESFIYAYAYRIAMRYKIIFENWQSWTEIIKSVDIFMSAPLGISSVEKIRKDMPTSDSPHQLHYNLIKDISPEAFKNIENTSAFYFIRTLALGAENSGLGDDKDFIPSTESDISKIENLIHQEVMSDDNFSNHKYGSETSYVYNNRLHLANIKTTFFNGFNPQFFLWFGTADVGNGSYNGYSYTDAPGEEWNQVIIETEIATGISTEKVYSSFSFYVGSPIYKLFMSAFISYPDTRAKKMNIYLLYDEKYRLVKTMTLTAHNYLNLAYYVEDGLKPIVVRNEVIVQKPNTYTKIILREPSKIKVSELNNPMRFPNANTYSVGNGSILTMATNAMNVSDRNYGQYPLYIFTTQGIWTLNVGTETVYSTQTAPTFTEAPTTSVVCSTPFGVVFTTQQGLRTINGQSVDFISAQLNQHPQDTNIELPEAQCEGMVYLFNDKSFKEYLLDIQSIIYDPHESELIISDKESKYNYVLNISSQSFYQSTERIDLVIGNMFPNLYVVGGKYLKDYASANNPETHISLVLRPITFGTLDIKNLERVILRSLLVNINNIGDKKSLIMVHHSNDGVNFPALRGLVSNPCNRRDYDMGLFASSKFSQFLFTFAGVVDESSKLNFLDVQIRQEYTNTKMK